MDDELSNNSNSNNTESAQVAESEREVAPPSIAAPQSSSGSKSLLFDKLDWWISDEDIFTGLQMLGISISDLVLKEFGFLEHKLNGKSKGSCFVLFKTAETCARAFEYFKSNELCEGCIVKEGHPSVSSNPYRALGFGFQKQRQGTSSTFPDHTNTNRPGGPPLRHEPMRRPAAPTRDRSRDRRPQSIDRRSVQSSRRSRSRSRERDGKRDAKRARSRSPPSSRHNNKSNKSEYNSKERRRSRSRERADHGRDRKNRSRERERGRDSRDNNRNNSKRRSRSRDAPYAAAASKPAAKVDLRERLGKRGGEKPGSRSSNETARSIDVTYETIPSPEERTPVDYD